MPVYNGPSTNGPLPICALLCTILVHFFRISLCQFVFFHVALFPYCALFMLDFFHMAPFACYNVCIVIFSCCTFFRVGLLLCIALFDVALLHGAMISFFILLLLQSAHVAIFSSCSLFIFH